MSNNDLAWTVLLDWSSILRILKIHSINQISEFKREKALKKITKTYGSNKLLELDPSDLDIMVASELRELMKKELTVNEKKRERLEKQMKSKIIPMKRGGIIKIDPRDFKDLDPDAEPEEIFDYLYKKFSGENSDDDEDDDSNNYQEDSSGFYI